MWSKGRLKVTHLQSSVSLFAHLPLLHDAKSAQFICSHHTASTKIPEHQSIKSIMWRKKHVKEWLWIPLKMLEIWFCSVQYFSNISPNANFFSLPVDSESTPQFPFNFDSKSWRKQQQYWFSVNECAACNYLPHRDINDTELDGSQQEMHGGNMQLPAAEETSSTNNASQFLQEY